MVRRTRSNWQDWSECLADNHRPYAGHFSWESDRSKFTSEVGVLKVFEEALALEGNTFFSQARHRGQGRDPPDCEAVGKTGLRIGIEITELVDPASAAAARAGRPYEWKDWKHNLVPALQDRLSGKDSPTGLKDSPYSEYVLLIYSDEPWLEIEEARSSLAHHIFLPTTLITKAYLLFSYSPWEKRYPCVRLNIAERA